MYYNKIFVKRIIASLIIIDLLFSFLQFYDTPLYGDIEGGVIPGKVVKEILNDPFGFNTILTGYKHPNPNRFFSHYAFMKYFQNVPVCLQKVVEPTTSVYLSCAIIKLFVQVFFTYFLSLLISNESRIYKKRFLIAAILILPLFQVYGYWSRMGIVDKSIAYTFFYGLPLTFLILFYVPVFRYFIYQKKIKNLTYILLISLAIVLPFSGPLIPGVVLIINLLIFGKLILNWKIEIKQFLEGNQAKLYVLLFFISVLSLYSLYLGKYDTNFRTESIPLIQRYSRLPKGLYSQVFHSLGFPLMLIIIGLNVFIIKRRITDHEKHTILSVLKWIGIFSLIYILLLPLGGYRPYRSEIIRYDTFMPVTTALIFFFGYSSYFVFNHFVQKNRRYYFITIILVLIIFTYSDTGGLKKNYCEKRAFEFIANSPDKIVKVKTNCNVFSWSFITDYMQTKEKGELLYMWNITDEKKMFYLERE